MFEIIHQRRAALVLCAIAFALAPLSSSLRAQSPSPIAEMKARLYEQRIVAGMSPAQPPAKSAMMAMSAVLAPTHTADLTAGSATLFETFRDGNWEIYRADGAGAVKRLTFQNESDVLPRLTRNGSKAAFVSRRDGNYEIYTMNAVGSEQTRVTRHGAVDTEPEWMPGDQALIFATNRNSTYDIWTVNADGTNTAPFAADGAIQEFAPDVAADGKISWVQMPWSAGSGNLGAIVTQNYDLRIYDSPFCAYMGRPRWSPDSTTLAFDCDIDGDEWNEVVIKAPNKPLFVLDLNEDFVDAQLNAWTPDGSQIVFTRVAYTVVDERLAVASLIPLMAKATMPSTPVILPFATGAEAYIDMEWDDPLPPVSAFISPPRYLPIGNPVELRWTAIDRGPAGVQDFSYNYKIDDGGWEYGSIFSPITSRQVSVPGNATRKLTWMVRARDRAGNVEPMPTSGPNLSEMLIYADSLSGTLSDNRNVSLSGVTLQATQSVPPNVTTERDGAFFFPFTTSSPVSTHVVTFDKTGYAPHPPVDNTNARGFQVLRPYLHAADNIIVNGRFDQNSTSWKTAGFVSFGLAGTPSVGVPHATLTNRGASLSQQVTLPAVMHKPTLAFVYQVAQMPPPNPAPLLAVRIDDGIEQIVAGTFQANSPVMPTTDVPANFGTLDMQAWAGKTVTITFEVAGQNVEYARIVLDDVSMSSWNTPVPAQAAPSRFVSIAPGAVITISGDNFIPPVQVRAGNTPLQNVQWVDEKTIIATLPASLPFGRHDVVVTNAGGQENGLPSAIVIGAESYIPIALR